MAMATSSEFHNVAGRELAAVHAVVAKLASLALASAAALTGKKEQRSYALVNDTWSLLVSTLVAIGRTASCAAGSGKPLAQMCSRLRRLSVC